MLYSFQRVTIATNTDSPLCNCGNFGKYSKRQDNVLTFGVCSVKKV